MRLDKKLTVVKDGHKCDMVVVVVGTLSATDAQRLTHLNAEGMFLEVGHEGGVLEILFNGRRCDYIQRLSEVWPALAQAIA